MDEKIVSNSDSVPCDVQAGAETQEVLTEKQLEEAKWFVARQLTRECPLRLCPASHFHLLHVHKLLPNGKITCLTPEIIAGSICRETLEELPYSPVQLKLIDLYQ